MWRLSERWHPWKKPLPDLPDREKHLKFSWNANTNTTTLPPSPPFILCLLPLPAPLSPPMLPLNDPPHPQFSTLQPWITYGFCFPSGFWSVLHKPRWQSNRLGNWIIKWMVDDGLRLPHSLTSPVWIRWGLNLFSCSYEMLWLPD